MLTDIYERNLFVPVVLQDLSKVTRLEVVADTSQEDLSPLGEARRPEHPRTYASGQSIERLR